MDAITVILVLIFGCLLSYFIILKIFEMNNRIYAEIRTQINGQFYFVIRAKNHRTLCHSEGYHNFEDCVKSASLFECQIKDKTPKT
jgi:uncharacterized protein YegP (UPF0339 family)